jgi:2-hydroxyglutarate dehydrogenase
MLHEPWGTEYKLYYCKGHYYGYSGKPLVNRLIYPVPEKNLSGLGVHATLDLSGRMRFGPDTLYISSNSDYSLPMEEEEEGGTGGRGRGRGRLDIAHSAVVRYLPGLVREGLYLDYSGIRPKLSGPGEGFRDFVVREESEAGFPGFFNLIGIESPGLTSALAIAELINSQLLKNNT